MNFIFEQQQLIDVNWTEKMKASDEKIDNLNDSWQEKVDKMC